MSSQNMWENTISRLNRIMDMLNLKEGLSEYLRQPRKIIEVAVSVKRDTVKLRYLKATGFSIIPTGPLPREASGTTRMFTLMR